MYLLKKVRNKINNTNVQYVLADIEKHIIVFQLYLIYLLLIIIYT